MTRRIISAVVALVLIVCLLPINMIEAKAASAMKASDDIILYLKTMEGFTPIPRWDYVQWTVGYGNRCPAEHLERYLEEGIPIEEADALFLEQLVYFENQVNAFIDRNNLSYSQQQFDAVLSITYNCGAAWLTGDSELKKAVIDGTTGNTLIGLMSQWCTAGGEYLPGLMRRRLTEADIYLNGRYNTQLSDNLCYVFFDAGEGTASAVAQGFDCNLQAVPMVTATREGYTFLGWYTEEIGGVKVTYLDENLHQDTLYAHWQAGDGVYDGGNVMPEGITVKVTGSVVNVRSGPGTDYAVINSVVYGEKIVVTQVAYGKDGRLWGKIDKGWLCLEYTTYEDEIGDSGNQGDEDPDTGDAYTVPVYATILGGNVTVYNGPDSGYPKVGTLKENTEVLIVETYNMFGVWWGRLETGGWICLNRFVLVHDDQMLAHSVKVTVTNSYVNVRSGPGTSYTWLDSLSKGDVIEILAVAQVDSALWGRYSGGWVSLQYTNFDANKLTEYQTHHYGDWYTVEESTCVDHGQQRRDCTYCDHYQTQTLPYGDHTMGQWYQASEGTCVTEGVERRDCQHCSYYETQTTGLTDHSFGQWEEVLAPSCTEEGRNCRYCQYCDAFEEEILPAAGHDFGDWYETVSPTLTEGGEERRDCRNCEHYELRATEPAEHLFTDWYVSKEASCTEDGEMRRDCTDCEYFETKVIVATGHTYGQWEVISEGSCTEDRVLRQVCSHCGAEQIQTEIAAGHSMTDWYTETEASCQAEGLLRRDCQHCDYSETQTVEKLPHSFGDWYVSIEPTYQTPGQERRDCQHCDAYETREKAFDGEVIIRVYATITCSVLNVRSGPGTGNSLVGTVYYGAVYEVYEQQTVGDKVWGRIDGGWICLTDNTALEEVVEVVGHAHSFGDWYVVTDATCTTDGLQRRDCACGHYETEVIPAAGHSFGDWYVAMEATCTADGQRCRDCTCGHFETEVIPATGHSFGDWYTVTEATATQKGQERRDCQHCDAYETRDVDYVPETVTKIYGTLTGYHYLNIRAGIGTGYAIVGQLKYGERVEMLEIVQYGNHQWGRFDRGWVQITGYITLEEVEETVEHTHSFGDWYTVKEATCTMDGQQRRDCACGHTETEVIPAAGHNFGDWYTVTEATANQNGQERRDCQHCDAYETRETTFKVETVTKLYGTLTGHHYLRIRAGLGVNYAIVGQLTYGERVEILEIGYIGSQQWGRIDRGWICITGYITLEEVEEPVAHTHSYGDWYTETEATCTADGLRRRDCACGHRETEVIPAVGHNFGDWYTVTEATANQNGQERRDCTCGHYETRETVYAGTTVTKVYATITATSLNIRSGPGSGYSLLGYVVKGEVFEVYEQVQVGAKVWGRIDAGWICLTGYTTLEEVEEPVNGTNAQNKMTVTAALLNVRAGAGTSYNIVTGLSYGTVVTVLETKTVGGVTWARIAQGWVSMAYLR